MKFTLFPSEELRPCGNKPSSHSASSWWTHWEPWVKWIGVKTHNLFKCVDVQALSTLILYELHPDNKNMKRGLVSFYRLHSGFCWFAGSHWHGAVILHLRFVVMCFIWPIAAAEQCFDLCVVEQSGSSAKSLMLLQIMADPVAFFHSGDIYHFWEICQVCDERGIIASFHCDTMINSGTWLCV